MTTAVGFVQAALGFAEQTTIAATTRYIADIAGFVPFEESHDDVLEITEQPIEQGAKIADHAYKLPASVTIKFGWSNSSFGGTSGSSHAGSSSGQVAAIYQTLLALQASREPFPLMTGKRLYDNMLLKALNVVTDKDTEFALMVTATFREVILVTTDSVLVEKVPASAQSDPQVSQTTTNSGTQTLTPTTPPDITGAETILGS